MATPTSRSESRRPAAVHKRRLRRDIAAARAIVILGVGNPDRGDDGAGIRAAQFLKRGLARGDASRVKILLGYETPEHETGPIRAFGADLVLILDAVQAGPDARSWLVVEPHRLAEEAPSTHHPPLALLVRYLEESVGSRVYLLGIPARSRAFSAPLSDTAQKCALRLSSWIKQALDRRS